MRVHAKLGSLLPLMLLAGLFGCRSRPSAEEARQFIEAAEARLLELSNRQAMAQ